MSGLNWDTRQPTDWLASNGRWYPASKYPKGWSTSALPPAPDHGGVGSILRQYADTAVESVGALKTAMPRPNGPQTAPSAGAQSGAQYSAPKPPSSDVVPTGRGVADATVTDQRTYAPPVSAGAPPPPALGTADDLPAPPGRIRDDAPRSSEPAPPAAPRKVNTPYIPPPSSSAEASGSFDVVAGDLGRVLGSARRRIEKAINESAES